jgi:hypothetical protein
VFQPAAPTASNTSGLNVAILGGPKTGSGTAGSAGIESGDGTSVITTSALGVAIMRADGSITIDAITSAAHSPINIGTTNTFAAITIGGSNVTPASTNGSNTIVTSSAGGTGAEGGTTAIIGGAAGGGTAGPARLVSGDNTSSWESWASGALIVTGTAAESPPGATPLYLEVTINGTLCTLTALHA